MVIRIQSKGIKDVALVIRVDEIAKCSDIAFITTRENLDWHAADAWTEEDIQEYFGVDEFTWSQSDMYTNQLATQARGEYMAHARLTRGTYQTKISHLI